MKKWFVVCMMILAVVLTSCGGANGSGGSSQNASGNTGGKGSDQLLLTEEIRKGSKGNQLSRVTYAYDKNGNCIKADSYDSEDKLVSSLITEYDEQGRKVRESRQYAGEDTVDWKYEWEWDDLGGYTGKQYNGEGKLTAQEIVETNPAGIKIKRIYESWDDEGNPMSAVYQTWDDQGRKLDDFEAKNTRTFTTLGETYTWQLYLEGTTWQISGKIASYYDIDISTINKVRSLVLHEDIYQENGELLYERSYSYPQQDAAKSWSIEELQKLAEMIRRDGKLLTETEYDEHGSKTEFNQYSANNFVKYDNTYDNKGNLAETVVSGTDGNARFEYSYTFFGSGAVKTKTNVTYSANSNGKNKTVTEYDERGNRISSYTSMTDDSLVFNKEEWEYDDNDVVRARRVYDSDSEKKLYLQVEELYDESGIETSHHSWKENGDTIDYYIVTHKPGDTFQYHMSLNDDGTYKQGRYREYDEKGNMTYDLEIEKDGTRKELHYVYEFDEYGNMLSQKSETEEITYTYKKLSDIR